MPRKETTLKTEGEPSEGLLWDYLKGPSQLMANAVQVYDRSLLSDNRSLLSDNRSLLDYLKGPAQDMANAVHDRSLLAHSRSLLSDDRFLLDYLKGKSCVSHITYITHTGKVEAQGVRLEPHARIYHAYHTCVYVYITYHRQSGSARSAP